MRRVGYAVIGVIIPSLAICLGYDEVNHPGRTVLVVMGVVLFANLVGWAEGYWEVR